MASIHGLAAADADFGGTAEPTGTPATLHLAVTQSMARDAASEYRIDAEGRGVNPRHGLTLAFTPKGAVLGGGNGELVLRLERFGRGEGEPVRAATPHVDRARVEYDRGGGLREWFVNLPQGVEHGWTVAEPPPGDGPLVLELDTGRPPDQADDERLSWSGLVYHGLVALDTRGQVLPSRWAPDGDRLHIEVDDSGAVYPVLIDPWVEEAKLIAIDGAAHNNFGNSVAISGDTALVGAWRAAVNGVNAQGAAYVFIRNGEGWSEQAKLTADDGALADVFGSAVALSGDTALIGARDKVVVDSRRGAAYVFVRDGGVWSQQAKLTASDAATDDWFGYSVAASGDTALIGAARVDVGGNADQGAVYVFTRSGDVWTQQTKLTASDGADGDQFGVSVALSGDTALAGAWFADPDGSSNQGAAYVYVREGGVWSEQSKLTATDGAEGDSFGYSVAVDGDTALAGALEADIGGNASQGAAYVFTRGGVVWTEQAKLTASDGSASDRFGWSVAVSGDSALVGAPEANVDGNSDQGAAYVFTRSSEMWSAEAKLTATDGAADDNSGRSVSLDGDRALVGAQFSDPDAISNRGATYVFVLEGGVGTPIIDVDPDSLSSTLPQGQMETQSLTITNLGDAPLEWEVAEPSGCVLADWVAIDPLVGSVPVGTGQVVDVTFDTTGLSPGGYETSLCLISNDPVSPLTMIPVNLTVAATPMANILPGSFEFEVEAGAGETQTLNVGNLGTADLDWSIDEADSGGGGGCAEPGDVPWLSASPESGTTPVESNVPVDITVDTTDLAEGEYTAQLCVTTNDPELPLVEVPVHLTVFTPIIDVDPNHFMSTLEPGQMETQPLTIANLGEGSLDWEVTEEGGISHPSASSSSTDTVTITHSEFLDVIGGNSEACGGGVTGPGQNQFLRTFSLTDFGILDGFEITEVTFGIETLSAATPITVNLYTLEGEFVYENLVLIGTAVEELSAQDLTLVTVPVTGTVSVPVAPAGSTLVVEIATPESAGSSLFLPGSNSFGETAPSYIACDPHAPAPTSFADFGFPNVHLAMTVTGKPLNCALPDWMAVEPLAGTVPGGDAQFVDVTLDATGLIPGENEASLCLASSDPNHPLLAIPVTLTVTVPPHYAAIEGAIESLGYCGTNPGPVVDAEVVVGSQVRTYTVSTDEDGFYELALDATEGPVDITVSAPGHLPQTLLDVELAAGETVIQDFGLRLEEPCAGVDPEELQVEVRQETSETFDLTIHNVDGGATLEWAIDTAEPLGRSASTPAVQLSVSDAGGVVDCDAEPGIFIHDDGAIEHGYSGNFGAVTEQVFVDRFTPSTYPSSFRAVCLSLLAPFAPTSLDFDIVVFADDGPEGGPGTELGALPVSADDIPVVGSGPFPPPGLEPVWFSYDISSLGISIDSGSVYIGLRWMQSSTRVEIAVDQSTGNPVGFAGGYWWNDHDEEWTPLANAFDEQYRSLFVRAVENPGGCHEPSSVPWLSVAPTSGSTSAGGASAVQLTLDATDLAMGEYRASVCVETNDAMQPLIVVPVALTVTFPPHFAVIEGTVEGLGLCGAEPGPIVDTQVVVQSQTETYTVFPDENGLYQLGLDAAESPVDVTASAPGHVSTTIPDIDLLASETVTLDFALLREEPCATVEPQELGFELAAGAEETQIVGIGNLGGTDLDWSIETSQPQSVAGAERPLGMREATAHAGSVGTRGGTESGRGDAVTLRPASRPAESFPSLLVVSPAGGVVDCDAEPGIVIHDDGQVNNGYSASASPVVAFVDRFTPSTYPAWFRAVCVAFAAGSGGPSSMRFEIVMLDDDGPAGGPGTELGALAVAVDDIPEWPVETPTWASFDISSLAVTIDSGSVFIGVRWPTSNPNVFITADESNSNPPGFAGGYLWFFSTDTWAPIVSQPVFSGYRSLFVRAVEHAGENPKDCFDPTSVPWLSITPDTGSTPSGGSTPVEVTVDATGLTTGAYDASLCVATNDARNPMVVVPVHVTVLGSEVAFDRPSVDFGEVEGGTTSQPETVLLQNVGTMDALDLVFEILGDSGFEADASACGTTLPLGDQCEVDITFKPQTPGLNEAVLEVHASNGAIAAVELAGHGLPQTEAFLPIGLEVDTEVIISDANGVFEPGELVPVAPIWRNDGLFGQFVTGSASNFTGPEGPTYSLLVAEADYGEVSSGAMASCLASGPCYEMDLGSSGVERPTLHWDATFDEALSDGTDHTWTLHIGDSFVDVPRDNLFYRPVETLLHSGVTDGCTSAEYCPASSNSRAQMAVFLLRAVEGGDYTPPACVADEEEFFDVPAGNAFCPWIEELAVRGVTSGCGGGNYCPADSVSRAQMAVFLLKAAEGDDYVPPPCTGAFSDVLCPSTFAAWIEDLAAREITGGCSETKYCPATQVTRAQMASFLTRAFGLELYGP